MRKNNRETYSIVKLVENEMEKKIKEEQSATKFAIALYFVGFLGLLLFFLCGWDDGLQRTIIAVKRT